MALAEVTRRCYRCGEHKDVGEFASDRTKGSGLKSICRKCDREKARAHYRANRDSRLAASKAHYARTRRKDS